MRELRVVQIAYWWNGNHPYDYRPNWTPSCILNSQWPVRYRVTLGAAVCKHRESAVKTEISKYFIFSQKEPFGETFSKITIKVSKEFSFSRKPPKSEMLPHAGLKPLNFTIFKALGKKGGWRKQVHLWQVSKASQLQYYLVNILQDNEFFTRLKNARRFLSSALS